MQIALPREVSDIIKKLEDKGYEAYAVGGCIRDVLMDRQPKDWDITTDALPEEIKEIFPVTIDTGIAHGTVTVRLNKKSFEVTTYRTDGKYSDGRHPDEVTFVRDLKEDLRRRDFTINALAYNPSRGLIDEFSGIQDLEKGIIRCVEDPHRRFSEDALRMMRAVRFVAQLGFELDENTKQSIVDLAPTLSRVSVERICDELIKLICSDRPSTLNLLSEVGLTKVFFPEWEAMKDTLQNTKHHVTDVAGHTIMVMENVPPTKALRLAAMLHDVAKPICRKTDSSGQDHFIGHPQVGAGMAYDILRRLKLDNDTIRHVKKLVLYHDERPAPDKRIVRRAISRMGEDVFPDIITIRVADVMGQSDYRRQEKLDLIHDFERLYDLIIQDKECLSVSDLAVTGKDLMDMGIPKGPVIGEVLKSLLALVLDNPDENTKDNLLIKAKSVYENI